ncbi:Gfo/Idh/MocA family protein [Saccharospirillum mangrovi]|uniref:Gfo/Idh/MocA family protein n=1 Tax=Saccharospirillum mangrovi TaxID=2161747 RepID=UPI000D3478D8|nr:Gfo/Idh/MocA family oxidoreductase [Saccharospirillum mangrovi]
MLRWGVMGTGNIAHQFVRDAYHGRGGKFVGVYSRNQSSAEAFAKEFGLPHAFSDLDAFLASPDIDVVYVASPHTSHVEQGLALIDAGKAALVEKPVAVNVADAEKLYRRSQETGVFCQEAFWTRFNPVYQQILKQARDGRLGALRFGQANFGFRSPSDPQHRLNNPDLAGGALLDIGLYPLILTLDLFGEPADIDGRVTLGDSGVDRSADLVLSYANGERCAVHYSIDYELPQTALISGERGWVELQSLWFAPNSARWQVGGGPVQVEHYPLLGKGYHYEFTATNEAIAAGRLDCAEHTQADSLTLMRLLDRIRNQWGPRYPFE